MDDLKKQFDILSKSGNVPLGGFTKEDFKNNPRVKMLIGKVTSKISGLIKILIKAIITTTIIALPKPAGNW